MNNFTYENHGSEAMLVYHLDEGEHLDSFAKGMLQGNEMEGILRPSFTQRDKDQYLKYPVTSKLPLKEFLSGEMERETVLKLFLSLAAAVKELEEYMLSPEKLVLDAAYVFVDVRRKCASLVYLPVDEFVQPVTGKDFLRDLLSHMRFQMDQDVSYVAKLLHFLNQPAPWEYEELKRYIEKLITERDMPGFADDAQKNGNAVSVSGKLQAAPAGQVPLSAASAAMPAGQVPQTPVSSLMASGEAPQPPVTPLMPSGQASQPSVTPVMASGQASQHPVIPSVPSGQMPQPPIPPMSSGQMPQPPIPPVMLSGQTPAVPLGQMPLSGSPEKKKLSLFGKKDKKDRKEKQEPKPEKKKGGLFGNKKKKEPKPFITPVTPEKTAGLPVPPIPPVPGGMPVSGMPPVSQVQPQMSPVSQAQVQPQMFSVSPQENETIYVGQGSSDEDNRTVIMGGGEDYGATMLLGGAAGNNSAGIRQVVKITRRRTGQSMVINRDSLRIGSEGSFVDFYIADNPAIGGCHADIARVEGVWYITDRNSANHTYVNGKMVPPMQAVPLGNGAVITLADEEFDFIIS